MATMNISLPDTMKRFVEGQVQSGEFANASDYVRDLIRRDEREHQLVLSALRHGEESGRSEQSFDELFDELLGSPVEN
jgi:antitoxin ParD1/3/4